VKSEALFELGRIPVTRLENIVKWLKTDYLDALNSASKPAW
jgi:hypothetical protein